MIYLVIAAFFTLISPVSAINIWPCDSNVHCETVVGRGSKCVITDIADGSSHCSNPFHEGGCLKHYGVHNKLRVCNSEDPSDTKGCRPPPMNYLEVRVHAQDWETAIVNTWIVQIILTEVLEVPTSIETGMPGHSLDFYNKDARLDIGSIQLSYPEFLAAEEAGGDCRQYANSGSKEEYTPCAHVFPEIWGEDLPNDLSAIKANLYELGALSGQGWNVPLFTVQHDPTLSNFVGLQGEANRRKLAETFKRPTNWLQYCQEVSTNNCTISDQTAQRPPKNPHEESSYFAPNLFQGYFRYTEQNDCDKHPDTCTGHFANYPCDWGGFFPQQVHHLNIALESNGPDINGGYTVEQIIQHWYAANATKEHLMGMWGIPDPTVANFIGTDAELIRVTLRPPTQECSDNRIDVLKVCGDDEQAKIGLPEGACDNAGHVLKKLIGTALQDHNANLPKEVQSPAFEFVRNYRINGLQLDQIFHNWFEQLNGAPTYTATGSWNSDPRNAVCRWVVDNLDALKDFTPKTYPRVVHQDRHWGDPFYTVAGVMACLAIILTVGTCVAVYVRRTSPAVQLAQVAFLELVGLGLTMVSIAALVKVLDPNESTCMSSLWLSMVGYSLELAPLVVKVTAINKIMGAAKKMQRVKMSKWVLFQMVIGIVFVTIVLLTVWTFLDPMQRKGEYSIDGDTTDDGETIVFIDYYCASDSGLWHLLQFAWHGILLLWATVLAVQNRKIKQKSFKAFNESKVLAMMLYSNCVFMLFRILIYLLAGHIPVHIFTVLMSLSLSMDSMVTIVIYFLPKLLAKDDRKAKKETLVSGIPTADPLQGSLHSISSSRGDVGKRPDTFDPLQGSLHSHSGTGRRRPAPPTPSFENNVDPEEGKRTSGATKPEMSEIFLQAKVYELENEIASLKKSSIRREMEMTSEIAELKQKYSQATPSGSEVDLSDTSPIGSFDCDTEAHPTPEPPFVEDDNPENGDHRKSQTSEVPVQLEEEELENENGTS